jgi:hypothetical protein
MADSGICHVCQEEETMTNKLVEQSCDMHWLCENCFNEGINCCSVGVM